MKPKQTLDDALPHPAEYPIGSPASRAAMRLQLARRHAKQRGAVKLVNNQLAPLNADGKPDEIAFVKSDED